MHLPALLPGRAGADIPIDQLAQSSSLSEPDKVHEATRQFEAVLLRQILTNARKTVIQSDDNSKSAASQIYEDMVTNQLADAISNAGTFGLARSLEVQLRDQAIRPPAPWNIAANRPQADKDSSSPAQSPHRPPAPHRR